MDTRMVIALTLATTGLGVLLPVFRDSGVLETQFWGAHPSCRNRR
jgi:hypothetical protein